MPDEPKGLQYAVLRQTHPSYDAKRIEQINWLYEGGFEMAKHATEFLPRLVNEDQARYEERCYSSAYKPYLGQIIDQFVADLFEQQLSVTAAADADDPETPGETPDDDFYREFARDTDGCANALVDILRATTTTALKHGVFLVQIDAPEEDPTARAPATKADEEEAGDRYYAFELDAAQLIDWRIDKKTNRFIWAIVHNVEQERVTPAGTRDSITERFTIWSLDGAEPAQVAVWARYEITYDVETPPTPERIVPKVAEGRTAFTRIPIVRRELPKGLWVANKIALMAIEYFQRRSALIAGENRSLVAIPTVYLGPEIGAQGGVLPAEVQQNPGRGRDPVKEFERKGFLVLGKDDKLEFPEPEGKAFQLVDDQLDDLRDDMFAVNHQMAASVKPTDTALGRSGLSKMADAAATAKVLGALGHEVRQCGVAIYDVISTARAEDVIWTAHGLENYDVEDREVLLEEVMGLPQIDLKSVTAKRLYTFRLTKRLLPEADPATLLTIKEEQEAGITAEEDMRVEMDSVEHDATIDALKNPPPVVQPGKGLPKLKKPGAKAA